MWGPHAIVLISEGILNIFHGSLTWLGTKMDRMAWRQNNGHKGLVCLSQWQTGRSLRNQHGGLPEVAHLENATMLFGLLLQSEGGLCHQRVFQQQVACPTPSMNRIGASLETVTE